jgi:hypothetical protein
MTHEVIPEPSPLWCITPPLTRHRMKPDAPGTWRFCVTTINGRRHYAIEHHGHGGTKEAFLGSAVRYDLTPEQMGQSLDGLIAAFKAKEAAEAAPDTRPSWERDPVLKAKMVERVALTIVQSHEKGERDNARALYKRLTGEDFNG